MVAQNLSLPGWYAAWIADPRRGREACVVFGFRDQDHHFVVELGRRFVALDDPALTGARLVGPFHSPEAAQAAIYIADPGLRAAARGA